MKQTSRKGLLITIAASMVLALVIFTSAIANNAAPVDYEQIGIQIRDRLLQLEEKYRTEMTGEQMLASAAIYDRVGLLNGEEDWQRLLNDLEACDTANGFAGVISGKYLGITEADERFPSRLQVEQFVSSLYEYIQCPQEPIYTALTPLPAYHPYAPCWLAIIGNSDRIIHVEFGADIRPLNISAGFEYITTDRLLTEAEKQDLAKSATKFLDLWETDYLRRSEDIMVYDTAFSTQEGVALGAVSIPMQVTDNSQEADQEAGKISSFILVSLNDMKIYEYSAFTDPDYVQNYASMTVQN